MVPPPTPTASLLLGPPGAWEFRGVGDGTQGEQTDTKRKKAAGAEDDSNRELKQDTNAERERHQEFISIFFPLRRSPLQLTR